LFKPSKSSSGAREVVTYKGERKVADMAAFVAHHMPSHVRRVTVGNFDKLFEPKGTAAALLFTDKTATTPLFKALSIAYKNRLILGEVCNCVTVHI
jgi:protein disulfide-isomerase A6